MTGGVSHRVPGETPFSHFHNLFGPGIEYAWLDSLSSAEVTNAHFPAEPFQDVADLDLPDESLGLLSRGLCGLALIDVVLRRFWVFS